MRTFLLAGAAALAFAAAAPRPAHALFGEGDIVFDPTAVAKLADEIRTLENQLTQLRQTYQALAHLTNINGVATELGLPSVQNPLGAVSQVPGLLNGSRLAAGAQQFLDANRYYQPQGNDFLAQEMQRRAQSTANIQALAQQNLQATEDRMAGLQELQGQIDASPTTQDMGAVQARLNAESNFISVQQAQAQQLQVLQRVQEQASQQRVAEWQRQSAEKQFNSTQPMGQGGAGPAGPSTFLSAPTFTSAGGPGS